MFGPVTRRPKGTAGNPIRVTTNMYPLQLHPDRVIYLYNVEIIPELSETASRRNYELIDILQTRAYPQAFTPRAAYDGSKIMLSTVQYPWGGAHEFNVVTSKRNPPPPPGQKGNFIIKLTAGPSFPIASLANYVRSPNSFPPDVVVNYTNIFLRMAPMSAHAFRGNNFYVTAGHKVFGDWLMLRRGFFQSVRATVNGPMVNMDITSALLWIQRPLMETIISILGLSDHRALSRLDERQLHHLNRLLKGIRVIPLHRQDAAPKVIRGFDRRGANSIRLDGDGITVEDYIHEKYNKRLSYPNYLCVSLSNDKQNILPIELLAIDKNQFFDLKKLANPVWDKQIRAFAMVKPSERLRITNTGCEVMQHAQSDYMIRAGIRVNPTALMVNARSLRPVVVSFANGSKVEPRHGAWRSQKFYQPSSIKFWAVIILDHQAPPQGVKNFIGQLVSVMEHGGMRVLDQTPTLYPKDARQDITQLLDYVKADLMKRFKEPPSLLLVVTPGDADWYTDVKRLGDITLGIPTQHVLTAKALQQRGSAEYCENVALKINVKLGGINFVPHPDAISWIRNPNEPTMVVGADTSHPRPGEGWKPTVAAIAFSVDRDVSKYNGTVTIQKGRQEIIANIVSMLRTAITAFKKSARVAPRRILYYRDGVGEGMYEEIAQQELQGIRQAFKELNEAPPKITFIVVGKRHHLRFYPDKRDEDRSGNANPGLVIDNTITSTIHDDFYLLAHQGIIGTSRPMHAVPIMDENNLSSDMLQGLTFALTHNYQRATRSVSIPAPIYYADILCSPQRARIHFDGSVDFASETASSGGPVPTSTQYLQAFKPVALRMRDNMYWM